MFDDLPLSDIMADTGNVPTYDWQMDYGQTVADGLAAGQQLATSAASNASAGSWSLKDIFGNVTSAIKAGAGAIAALNGAGTGAAAPRPNTARAVGGLDLRALLLIGAGFLLMRG